MSDLQFVSTRGGAPALSVGGAILQGLAPDGGLYIPTRLPHIAMGSLDGVSSLPDIARVVLDGFFEGDRLRATLGDLVDAALDVPAPTTRVAACRDPLHVLELFHGPTAAFKDFGARFLAESLQRLDAGGRQLTILVATSGDTGGAVAAAFHRRPWVRVVILYPRGLVSPRQEQQLTCWGDNVASLRIGGTFDDCQRLVKEAFLDESLRREHRFSSANSINIGRLLPQMTYYIGSCLAIRRETGQTPSYIIPSGNLGNAFAAVWARALGFPIGRIVLAHNANRTVPDYLQSGDWRPRPSVATLASAMDVGNPSNMERLIALYPDVEQMRGQLGADSVDDPAIRARIVQDHDEFGRIWCPHTATAAEVYRRLPDDVRRSAPWVLVATAHPAKFPEVVEPLIGAPVEIPDSLARLLKRPQRFCDLPPALPAVAAALS